VSAYNFLGGIVFSVDNIGKAIPSTSPPTISRNMSQINDFFVIEVHSTDGTMK
jgi:hypothetical protein